MKRKQNSKKKIKINYNTILIITLTDDYQLKCSLQKIEDGKEIDIILDTSANNTIDQEQVYTLITITFDMNEISVGKETPNAISFMKEWIDYSDEYKHYEIQYQNKEYSVIAELLFALFINEFKKKIEKQWIIIETQLQLPSHVSAFFITRLKISLEAIGLKEIHFDDSIDLSDEIRNIYDKQKVLLYEITEKHKEYERYKKKIEKNTDLQIDQTNPFGEREYIELIRTLSLKERTEKKLCELDNYCLFLHLNTLQQLKIISISV